MVRTLVALALALAPFTASASPADEAEIVRLEQAWRTARIKGDAAFLERFYAKEFRVQDAGGGVVERDADIELFRTRAIRPEFINAADMKVAVYGDTAVVTGVDDLQGTYRGNFGAMKLRFTDVLVRRDGRWQLVAHQSTMVPKK